MHMPPSVGDIPCKMSANILYSFYILGMVLKTTNPKVTLLAFVYAAGFS